MHPQFMCLYKHGGNMGKVSIDRCAGRCSFYDGNMSLWQFGIFGNGIAADIKFACDRTLA